MNTLAETEVAPAPTARPALGRVERNKRDKRNRILRAARELFRRKGFHQTTTSEIAELADVGKGTLFLYAHSKEDLLVQCFQEDVGRSIERAFATVPQAPFLDQVMHVFGVMIEQNRRDMELARVFVKEMAFVTGDRQGINEVVGGFFKQMTALIERAQQRGEITGEVSASVLARNLFALYFSRLLNWLGWGAPSPEASKPSLRQMIETQLLGLRKTTKTRLRRRGRTAPTRKQRTVS
ncbi:MAG: TetR/AcrR family transcriptional regulator [Thermodesulfobacteriota bacterium]